MSHSDEESIHLHQWAALGRWALESSRIDMTDVSGSRVVLTTAHVYDHAPEVCDLLNLAALCQRCHLRHDAGNRKK